MAGAIALALLVQAFLMKPFSIPSESMVPTLKVDQRVLVNRASYHFGSPSVGDIVVFKAPVGANGEGQPCGVQHAPNEACPVPVSEISDVNFIKRVVAEPGDLLRIVDGTPVVNGQFASEDFITPCGASPICDLEQEIEIPEGHYFVMGDNRGASKDSREWGPVPEDAIIGKAFATYWPLDRIGLF